MTTVSNLTAQLADKPWFCTVETDQYGRLVVYTKTMSPEVSSAVPDTFEGKQVLLHFAPTEVKPIIASSVEQTNLEEPEALTHSVWRLKRICGADELYDCLYEIIDEADGLDVMTHLSEQYPEVRQTLERLYKTHGIDVILKEVER